MICIFIAKVVDHVISLAYNWVKDTGNYGDCNYILYGVVLLLIQSNIKVTMRIILCGVVSFLTLCNLCLSIKTIIFYKI